MHSGSCIFQSTLEKTHIWLQDLMQKADLKTETEAYKLLRAALHSLRDRITSTEAIHLASELPMLLRGSFYEGFKFTKRPIPLRSQEDFLRYFLWKLASPHLKLNEADRLFRSVASLLNDRISEGEVHDLVGQLPKEIQNLFRNSKTSITDEESVETSSRDDPIDDEPFDEDAQLVEDDIFDLNAEELKRANKLRNRLIEKEGFSEEQANSIVLWRTGKNLGDLDPDMFDGQIREMMKSR